MKSLRVVGEKVFLTKKVQNHTLLRRTHLYSLYRGVPLTSREITFKIKFMGELVRVIHTCTEVRCDYQSPFEEGLLSSCISYTMAVKTKQFTAGLCRYFC